MGAMNPLPPDRAHIVVLGAGSWGTALASHLALNGHVVRLWGRDGAHLRAMQRERVNARYLPGLPLPASLCCEFELAHCLENCDCVLIATPSQGFFETLQLLRSERSRAVPIIWASKGIQAESSRLFDELITEVFGFELPRAIISGPSFAVELMRGLPTAVSVAAQDRGFALRVARWLHSATFRAYYTDDVIGVEIGGALKNVFAIAAGISDGMGFGANARSALITRSLAELMRLGVAMGGRAETLMGLAGMGDLVLTCTDDLSRNRRLGLALAGGASIEAARYEIGQAVEGIEASREAARLAVRHGVDMPIAAEVNAILHCGKSPQAAVGDLLGRVLRPEFT